MQLVNLVKMLECIHSAIQTSVYCEPWLFATTSMISSHVSQSAHHLHSFDTRRAGPCFYVCQYVLSCSLHKHNYVALVWLNNHHFRNHNRPVVIKFSDLTLLIRPSWAKVQKWWKPPWWLCGQMELSGMKYSVMVHRLTTPVGSNLSRRSLGSPSKWKL